jgi:hypothetical protein
MVKNLFLALFLIAPSDYAWSQEPPKTLQVEAAQQTGQRKIEEGTEFLPPLYGYRLKVTDTLLVIVTFLLFGATVALSRSTQKLVRDAKKTLAW